MQDTTRRDLTVSRSTDAALRRFLVSQGHAEDAALSRFVEEAVQAHILEPAAASAKQQNAHRSDDEIGDAVDQALQWASRGRR